MGECQEDTRRHPKTTSVLVLYLLTNTLEISGNVWKIYSDKNVCITEQHFRGRTSYVEWKMLVALLRFAAASELGTIFHN